MAIFAPAESLPSPATLIERHLILIQVALTASLSTQSAILKTKWSLPLFSFSHPFPPPAPREHQQTPRLLRNLHSRPQTRTPRPPWPPPGQTRAVCVWRNKKINYK